MERKEKIAEIPENELKDVTGGVPGFTKTVTLITATCCGKTVNPNLALEAFPAEAPAGPAVPASEKP